MNRFTRSSRTALCADLECLGGKMTAFVEKSQNSTDQVKTVQKQYLTNLQYDTLAHAGDLFWKSFTVSFHQAFTSFYWL